MLCSSVNPRWESITAIAPRVKHLTVFQRSPQYSVPVGNGPVTPEYVADVKKNYDEIWDQVMGFPSSPSASSIH